MERPKKAGALVVALVLILLPLFYVLSVGPAVWLFSRGLVSERVLAVLYAPVELAGEYSPLFMRIMQPYVNWWAGPPRAAPTPVPAPTPAPASTYTPDAAAAAPESTPED
jgi:hypothetical protein